MSFEFLFWWHIQWRRSQLLITYFVISRLAYSALDFSLLKIHHEIKENATFLSTFRRFVLHFSSLNINFQWKWSLSHDVRAYLQPLVCTILQYKMCALTHEISTNENRNANICPKFLKSTAKYYRIAIFDCDLLWSKPYLKIMHW